MKVHREPTVGVPSKSLKDPVRFNVLTRKECGYTICTACPLLAIQAMTQRNPHGVASTRDAKLLASAGRGSRHHGHHLIGLMLQDTAPRKQQRVKTGRTVSTESLSDVRGPNGVVREVPVAALRMRGWDAVPDAQCMQDGLLAFDETTFAKLPRFQTERGVVGQQKNRQRLIFCPN
jgi:hypothetical protein